MRRRLTRWRELDGRGKRRLLGCMAGLPLVHVALAAFGYKRTRSAIERLSRHPARRAASEAELADARALAELAAVAGRRNVIETTCLRRSLLLYGWLRRMGLQPVLQLGIPENPTPGTPFEAHAWVELEGAPLLKADNDFLPFKQ